MPNSSLTRGCVLLLLTTCVVLTLQSDYSNPGNVQRVSRQVYPTKLNTLDKNYYNRNKRGLFGKKGFLKTLFSVVYEQWADTKNTVNNINKMINDNFLDEHAPVVETTTSSDPNATTTEAPFKITRTEFNKIIRRNLKGIMRLFNLELNDALRQSHENDHEFKKQASKEVSKFL